jgi:small subunit ribosomal protein S20
MARHKSAMRQHRRSLRRKSINVQNRSVLRTRMRKIREAIKNNDQEEAGRLLPGVFSAIDKAVKKAVIKKNTGSRYKSRLNRQVGLLKSALPK